ncbi:MAG: SbcC/MukB-like Walker B domain-containing protein [Schaedlerella sp.]|nr:SbcC/MukB-like Walker B domain-containing protein [Schaedlerella sp.]
MKQPKKLFKRLLINNWGGISHKVLEFHEYINLFSGKSGSGKSTVMDAIQVVLYGSVSANFLNKAADDSKNRRSVLSYLRGAQKDGTSNRGNKDFYSHIVLEIEDTGTKICTCIGAAFEVGKNDADLRRYSFFSHSGKIPEDEYLTEERIPYSIAQIRKLVEQRSFSADNRGRGDVNRIYPSKEAYLNTLYDVIFGYVEPGRLMTMEKSAIALRMSNGTGQFIKDYMFPKSKEDTLSTISEQLGAYREIKESVEDLEKRISILDEIHKSNLNLLTIRIEKEKTENLLKYADIESSRLRQKLRKKDLEEVLGLIKENEEKKSANEAKKERKTQELIRVKAAIEASDYGQKEHELEEIKNTIELLAGNAQQWRQILSGLDRWAEDEEITDYVSNRALQLIQEFHKGNVSEKDCKDLKRYLEATWENIDEELTELKQNLKQLAKEVTEKREVIEDLKNDRKTYPKELISARAQLQSALSDRYGRSIKVYIFADLFDVIDEKWKDAVEGRLGRIKKGLLTEPAYALDASKIFRKMKRKEFEEIDLINTAAIKREEPSAQKGSLYEAVKAQEPYVDLCLKRYLGRIQKCETVDELSEVREGVTPDCYSYGNFSFRHLREVDYKRNACIGTKVSKRRLLELEDELFELQKVQLEQSQKFHTLNEAQKFERLNQGIEQIVRLSQTGTELEEYYKKQEKLQKEITELKEGTLAIELNSKIKALDETLAEIGREEAGLQKELIIRVKEQAGIEKDIANLEMKLLALKEGMTEDPQLQKEVKEALKEQSETVYKRKKHEEFQKFCEAEKCEFDKRLRARNQFNREYPAYGFSGAEQKNDVYDRILEKCRNDFEPKYKEEFEKQYELVYRTLRENVIAAIHSEIKAAYRHKREINRMLSKIRFSDSVYQIDILPAENENGQFYDMLMAEELDSKVMENHGFDGQMSFGEDEFYLKYEQKIKLLTEKFMPPREQDGVSREHQKLEMERYADYRNYLTFSMYEKVVDENGEEKKNYVDDMAGRDSGGEGQNPKYVALLAGFAMLYMQQSSRDSKIRLVLLDEAFSKMDKERSEVCLKYARELELQLIVCVPDERLQSLIRNVDSVYGFRRHQNQISMMHINKGNYLEMLEGDDKNIE